MNHKIKQKAYKKNRLTNMLNMTTKRNGIIILLAVILTVGIAGGLVGCTNGDSKVNIGNSVSYNGIVYVLQEDIGLNFDGFNDIYEGLGELCEKVGSIRQVDVYRIRGLEQNDWIYLDNQSMLFTNNPYGGIYRSTAVKMDTIADFKPDYLNIYYLTPPTSQQSGKEIQIFDSTDLKIIEKIVTAIENGKPVSAEKQAEVTKAMLYGESSYQKYRLEFSSASYPKLVYRLSYAEDANGKFYIGYYEDINAFKIIEIDNTLHEYLSAETSLGE